MRKIIAILPLLLFMLSAAHADSGLVTARSAYDVKTTAERLEQVLKSKGMNVFIRIDHSANAQRAGMQLQPTELIIFGNPNVGTPLMQCAQTIAIDLPQKALIWEDKSGQTWLTYNDPAYLAKRHGIAECKDVMKKVGGALQNFARAATTP